MADLGSQNNSITVNVSSGGNKTNVSTTYDSSIYYSSIAREWAISNQLVNDEDYSSKYYANESKKQTDIVTSKATEVTTTSVQAITDINTAKTNALSAINEQEEDSVNNVISAAMTQVENVNTAGGTQVSLATEQATIATQQATIATNKTDEVVSSGNTALSNIGIAKTNAITSITEQETTSKNNVIATGTAQIELIQQEAQERISNIEQLGFYMRDNKLYYIDGNGQEQEFESGGGTDTVPLFTGMYFDFSPNNVSWLKAGEQANSGGIYTSCYNTLVNCLTEANNIYDLKVIATSDMEAGVDYSEYWKVNQDEMWFKTPTKISYLPINANTIPVVGNGITLGLTDGTNNYGLESTSSYALSANKSIFSTPIGSTSQEAESINKSLGVTTDPSKSGIVADLSSAKSSTAQLYFKVANAVENLELLNAGEILESLADKVSRQDCKAYIIETYQNGSSGYNVYSNGYCEQWGDILVNYTQTSATVNLMKTFTNTNYNIQITAGGHIPNGVLTCNWQNKDCSSFDIYGDISDETISNISTSWEAKGYLAEGE